MGHFYPFLFSFKTSLPFFFLLWFSLLYATYLSLSKLIFLYLLPSLTIVKAHHNFDDLQLGMFVAREYFRFWLSFDLFFQIVHGCILDELFCSLAACVYLCISYLCPNIFHFLSVSMGMFLLFQFVIFKIKNRVDYYFMIQYFSHLYSFLAHITFQRLVNLVYAYDMTLIENVALSA